MGVSVFVVLPHIYMLFHQSLVRFHIYNATVNTVILFRHQIRIE